MINQLLPGQAATARTGRALAPAATRTLPECPPRLACTAARCGPQEHVPVARQPATALHMTRSAVAKVARSDWLGCPHTPNEISAASIRSDRTGCPQGHAV